MGAMWLINIRPGMVCVYGLYAKTFSYLVCVLTFCLINLSRFCCVCDCVSVRPAYFSFG